MRRRKLAFASLAAVCVIGAIVTALIAVLGARQDEKESERAVAAERPRAEQILSTGEPFAVARSVDRAKGATYGRIVVSALKDPGSPVLAGPACERVGFRAGRGICLELLGTQMSVDLLDSRLNVTKRIELAGIPSRARVSPDGRWGGTTAFIVGHSYAAPGEFSTATTLLDLRRGEVVGNIEEILQVTRDGKRFEPVDRNFWGLTFSRDSDTFYATMASGGKTWLIQGSIKDRRAKTIHENVECPALSPDETRIGYKKAVATNPAKWRFHVLDLATGRETALAETRSIDDQLEWLDDDHLLYGDGERTWVVPADGSGEPEVWSEATDSTTVQEGTAAGP